MRPADLRLGSADARTIYVTVTDKAGTPVEDLTAADFEIKEGGKAVDIAEAGIAKNPLQIALIVDDNGTGLFRVVARPVRAAHGRPRRDVAELGHRADDEAWSTTRRTPRRSCRAWPHSTRGRARRDGGQLLEGISEAAIELKKREAERPMIIALTVGGEEHSTVNSDHVLDQLRKSGAILHVFSVERSALRSTVKPPNPRDLLQENMHLNRVLGDGPKQTGGRHQSIVASAGFLAGLQSLAAEP